MSVVWYSEPESADSSEAGVFSKIMIRERSGLCKLEDIIDNTCPSPLSLLA